MHADHRSRLQWSVLLVATTTVLVVVALGAAVAPAPPSTRVAAEVPVASSPESTPYPYATASRVGPWGFYTRHSTDYVAWRLYERDVDFSSKMRGPNGKTGNFGDPGTWAANAAEIGFQVDSRAKPGAIAHWKGGEDGVGQSGHVAYVDRVNPDGSVVISEFNLSVKHGYSQRGGPGQPPVRAPRYIHVQDL